MKHKQYMTIMIDPPWPGPGATPAFDPDKKGKVPVSIIPYSTMTGIQCACLRVREIAHHQAQLFLWTPSRNIGDAFLLVQYWGFNYRALFTWMKPPGLGRHARHCVEFLIWAGRPGARLVEPKKCPLQVQHWPKPKRHSEKPPEAYDLIRSLTDGPRIDIFARQARPGFEPWGNEAPMPNAKWTNAVSPS
jgi:N6-adenosine-specific RNA methylase IME4